MFSSLILASVLSVGLQSAYQGVYLDCKDAAKFSQQSIPALERINENLGRMKSLAIQASNGAIGNMERSYLNADFVAFQDDTLRVIEGARFVDLFSNQYFYLNDGFSFQSAIYVPEGDFSYLQSFQFDSLNTIRFGALSNAQLKLQMPQADTTGSVLRINREAVTLDGSVDTLSTAYPWTSSISLAAAINNSANQTKVWADVDSTEVSFKEIDRDAMIGLYLHANDFKINGVDIIGFGASVSELVSTINDFSYSSGVQARLVSQHSDQFTLYANDGRNIEIELSKKLAEVLSQSKTYSVYNGAIRLYSGQPIRISLDEGFPILSDLSNGEIAIDVDLSSGLSSLNINYQETASDALAVIDQALSQLHIAFAQARMPALLCD